MYSKKDKIVHTIFTCILLEGGSRGFVSYGDQNASRICARAAENPKNAMHSYETYLVFVAAAKSLSFSRFYGNKEKIFFSLFFLLWKIIAAQNLRRGGYGEKRPNL